MWQSFAFFGLFFAPIAHAQHTSMPAGTSHDEHPSQAEHFGRHFDNADEWAKSFDAATGHLSRRMLEHYSHQRIKAKGRMLARTEERRKKGRPKNLYAAAR